MNSSDLDTDLLADLLQSPEQKLAESETVQTTTIAQEDAACAANPPATEDGQALRHRLNAKEEQLRTLHRELRQRDERIAQLERLCEQNADPGNAANLDFTAQHLTSQSMRIIAMGLALESLDAPGTIHRISRATTTIGRGLDNDITLRSTSTSRYHARIVVASDSTYLIDLQSTNGCHVNGERISRRMIGDGDVIAVGGAKFRFAMGAPLPEIDGRSMEETHVLLEHSVIFSPAPTPQSQCDAVRGKPAQDCVTAEIMTGRET